MQFECHRIRLFRLPKCKSASGTGLVKIYSCFRLLEDTCKMESFQCHMSGRFSDSLNDQGTGSLVWDLLQSILKYSIQAELFRYVLCSLDQQGGTYPRQRLRQGSAPEQTVATRVGPTARAPSLIFCRRNIDPEWQLCQCLKREHAALGRDHKLRWLWLLRQGGGVLGIGEEAIKATFGKKLLPEAAARVLRPLTNLTGPPRLIRTKSSTFEHHLRRLQLTN